MDEELRRIHAEQEDCAAAIRRGEDLRGALLGLADWMMEEILAAEERIKGTKGKGEN